jgi:hypothetical protein
VPQIDLAFAFGAGAQTLADALLSTFLQGLDEQLRVADQTFARRAARPLVMLEPAAQLTGGQRRAGQRLQQSIGMLGVGARQRGHHAGGRPARQPAIAHRDKSRLRQRRKQLQAPRHPAGITPAAAGYLVLRLPQPLNQLAHQQRLFDRREGPALAAGQHAEQGFGQVTPPTLDARRVAAEPAQGGYASIAVDQHQTLAPLPGVDRRIGHRNARHYLAAALDGTRDPRHRARLHQAGTGKAQLQAVQIKIQARRVHAGKASSAAPPPLSSRLFANFPRLPVGR